LVIKIKIRLILWSRRLRIHYLFPQTRVEKAKKFLKQKQIAKMQTIPGTKDKNVKFFHNQNSMNGLVNFIGEMRNCRVRELETKRVNKELANIRSNFKGNPTGYQLKKYLAKLLYMYILGYEIDFGHIQAVNLLSSPNYSEKQIVLCF
jgi:hypothetical protein